MCKSVRTTVVTKRECNSALASVIPPSQTHFQTQRTSVIKDVVSPLFQLANNRHLSRIAAHPSFFTIQIIIAQQPYCLGTLLLLFPTTESTIFDREQWHHVRDVAYIRAEVL